MNDSGSSALIYAASEWPTNAHLINDCARLGYLDYGDVTFDATYGRGIWWKQWKPKVLVTNDRNPEIKSNFHFDFRAVPLYPQTFDSIAFDPPYVSVGGRKTSGIPGLHDRYGLTDAPTTPAGVQKQINEGLIEMHRLLKRGGTLLCKVQDYVSSGKLWVGTFHTQAAAIALGFETIDRLEHVSVSSRPQPTHSRQLHARRNLSTLFVFEKRGN